MVIFLKKCKFLGEYNFYNEFNDKGLIMSQCENPIDIKFWSTYSILFNFMP